MKASLVARGVQALVDILVPDCCQLCGRTPNGDVPPPGVQALLHGGVDVRLIGPLSIRNHPLCSVCLAKLDSSASLSLRLGSGGLRVIAPFHTNATLLAIAHRIKFSRVSSLCGLLAAGMACAWEHAGVRQSALVPVPMDRRSLRSRGFNPAETIALEVGRRIGMPVVRGVLVKTRRTRPQSLTPREKRSDNVRDAFRVTDDRLLGRSVILVDDLVTTGATALECVAALTRAGALPHAVLCAGEAL